MPLRCFRRLWLPGLIVLELAGPAYAQASSRFVPGPWWKDFQDILGLSDDQSHRIEAVFQAVLPLRRHQREDLNAQEKELSRLIQAGADEGAIGKQCDRVEALRSVLNRGRTLMLFHMRAILSPDQRTKLRFVQGQWQRDHPQLPLSSTTKAPQ